MSQSESSEESMVTSHTIHTVQFVDLTSRDEEEEREEEMDLAMGSMEPTTIVTHEEIETMLKCTMKALDNNNEVMNILLQLNRMCNLDQKRK